MNRVKILSSDNISLVVPEKEDAIIWYKGINNLETQAFLDQFWNILHKETEEEYYESLRKNKTTKTFSIFVNETEKVIWNISLMSIDNISRNAEMWVMICDTDEQNKGYGTESIKLLLKYTFEFLGLHKVSLKYIDFNKRAKNIYEKIWFKEVGRKKEERYIYWKYNDIVLMEIMKNEWKK